jgi:hypothetical protein
MIALNNSKTPFTAIPKSLNGKRSNQIIGYKINTAIANGAQSKNNKSQSKNVVILYFLLILLKLTKILSRFRKNGQIGYLMV